MNPLSSLVSRCCGNRIAKPQRLTLGWLARKWETARNLRHRDFSKRCTRPSAFTTPEFGLSDILAVPLLGPESEAIARSRTDKLRRPEAVTILQFGPDKSRW